MKQFFLTAVLAITLLFANAAGPSKKALQAFQSTFNDVKDVKWHDVANGYEAFFTSNNITHRIIYDGEGNIVQSFRYYFQKDLPLHVISKLNKKFPGQRISTVVEQTDKDGMSYDVTLEDE